MNITIKPNSLKGKLAAIPSKSDVHRLMICAALSNRPTTFVLWGTSDDIEATLHALHLMGAGVERQGEKLTISPITQLKPSITVDARQSASTLRFLVPLAAAIGSGVTFVGSGRLPERPMSHIIEVLREAGVEVEGEKLPLKVGGGLEGGVFSLPGDVSSQYISGLLFALPLLGRDSEIILTSPLQSSGYVDMTISSLSRFGVVINKTESGYKIAGRQSYRTPGELQFDGDWSNSAFWLTAGALGGPISVGQLSSESLQGDRQIADLLKGFGAKVEQNEDGFLAQGGISTAHNIDAKNIPDLVPILAVAACGAVGRSVISNIERLRIKECDRVAGVISTITSLGGRAYEQGDSIIIEGSGRLVGGVVDSQDDHRIVMSAAIASLICDDEVKITDAQAVNKSYPNFFEHFNLLGGNANVE